MDQRTRPGEADHAVALEVIGQRKRLPVLPAVVNDPSFELKAGTPKTRADCPTTRPCPYVRCSWNLWMRAGQDRPGRRHVGGNLPASTIQFTTPHNCGADVADAVEAGAEIDVSQLASMLGVSDRQVRRDTESALAKLPARLQMALDSDEERATAVALLKELMRA